jgi:hypothetical protein
MARRTHPDYNDPMASPEVPMNRLLMLGVFVWTTFSLGACSWGWRRNDQGDGGREPAHFETRDQGFGPDHDHP